MGLFDRFRAESDVDKYSFGGADARELDMAIKKLKTGRGNEATLAKALRNCLDNKTWLPFPTQKDAKGYQITVVEERNKAYAVMYTAKAEARPGESIATTDIRKLIEPVYQNDDIDGIVINPHSVGLYLEKHALLRMFLHSYLPAQNNGGTPQRDWGKGIPAYRSEDIMTQGERLNFAMHTVLDYDEMLHAMTPISACDHVDAIPNVILRDGQQFVFICVRGTFGDAVPGLSQQEKETLLDMGQLFNASCYLAPVEFMSIDDERFGAGLALRGDGFYANYQGIKPVS